MQRSLKHEYELFVQEEIENYKDSVPRSALMSIGDEAVAALLEQTQLPLTELLLCEEVDRIIRRRLRLPSYAGWRRKRLKLIEKYRRPEHWNLSPNDAVVREVHSSIEGHVLVASPSGEGEALYLAANGCDVTAVGSQPEMVQRVLSAAWAAGLPVRGYVTNLDQWSPDVSFSAVICTDKAFAGLNSRERKKAIRILQSATVDGGVHLVHTLLAGGDAVSLEELRSRYSGWQVIIDCEAPGSGATFIARKIDS